MTKPDDETAIAIMPLRLTLLLVTSITLIVINAASRWTVMQKVEEGAVQSTTTWSTKGLLHSLQADLALLESGQRGYLLTLDPDYLNQYRPAESRLPEALDKLRLLVRAEPTQAARLLDLDDLLRAKLREMNRTVTMTERGERDAAIREVNSDRGKSLMDRAVVLIDTMIDEERQSIITRNARAVQEFRSATLQNIGIGVISLATLGVLYSSVAANLRRRLIAERDLKLANETLGLQVHKRTQQLSHLARHLISVTESEKATLARDMHDELGSNLTAIILDVSTVQGRLEKLEPSLANKLARASKLLRETVNLKRRIIQGLRPSMLDSLGLPATIRMHCEDFARRSDIPCHVEIPEDIGEIDPHWRISLFRVVQESLTNIAKYAHASSVQVKLHREHDGIRLRIIDDGVGIQADALDRPLSHGLIGMRERVAVIGGEFSVRPRAAAAGTIVEAFLPSATSSYEPPADTQPGKF
ncbi:MAG: CHASE3 domain-containing protein [Gammaproteobacteria bacterium]